MNQPVKSLTGNIAVDAVGACIAHYKGFGKRVKVITLSRKWWTAFERYAKENRPDFEFKNEIEFKNVILRKGSAFMLKNLVVELKKEIN